MKFHCDRCKTKYSISDDRVRGKILKIRCKNCSSVITVRESSNAAPASASATASGSGGARAVPKIPADARPSSKSKVRKPTAQPVAKPAGSKPASARPASTPGSSSAPAARAQNLSPVASPSPLDAGRNALAGAFKQAVREPSGPVGHSGSSSAPVSLDAEWYVSIDGLQEGPMDLPSARLWVARQSPEAELYCWSEGYDDWLPVHKVSHFRDVSRGGVPEHDPLNPVVRAPMASGLGPNHGQNAHGSSAAVETPKPLFAATMAAVSKDSPLDSADDLKVPNLPARDVGGGPPAATRKPARVNGTPERAPSEASGPSSAAASVKGEGGGLDFDIGEASRVVDLPALLAASGRAPQAWASGDKNAAAPADLGRGSGAVRALPGMGAAPAAGAHMGPAVTPDLDGQVSIPASNPKRRRGMILPIAGLAFLVLIAVGVLVIVNRGGSSGKRLARGTVGGSESIGYSFGDTASRKGQSKAVAEESDEEPSKAGSTKRPNRHTGKGKSTTSKSFSKNTTITKPRSGGSDEVDLGLGGDEGPTGPLDGDDLMKVYRKNNIAIKMCYERALKKNPLLKVPKTWVNIKVNLQGKVSEVKIPSLGNSELGRCLEARIGRWKFRKTTEIFSSRFPVVFGS